MALPHLSFALPFPASLCTYFSLVFLRPKSIGRAKSPCSFCVAYPALSSFLLNLG